MITTSLNDNAQQRQSRIQRLASSDPKRSSQHNLAALRRWSSVSTYIEEKELVFLVGLATFLGQLTLPQKHSTWPNKPRVARKLIL